MDVKETQLHGAGARHVWEVVRLGVVRDMLRRRLPRFGAAGDALLDVGCGDCYVMGELAAEYPQAMFVGADAALTKEMMGKINVLHPNARAFVEINEVPEKTKAVLLLDVLEHVKDDAGFLTSLSNRPELAGAEFFITVPAYNLLFSHHDRFLGHFRRYNLAQLREAASKAGLAVLQGGYFFFSLLPIRAVSALLDSARRFDPAKHKGVAGWKGGKFLNRIVASMLFADYKVSQFINKLGVTLPGLSCYVVCKKR